jgi:Asp-tRNA(Asn)/Glu-tRNA(Gln) amidotransferase C subunit
MSTATEIQELARLAGLELPEERAAALVISLRTMQDAARVLASIDYGGVEPSGRFRVPRSGTK